MSSIFVIALFYNVGMHPDVHGDHRNQHYRQGFKSEKTYRLINMPLLKDAILTSENKLSKPDLILQKNPYSLEPWKGLPKVLQEGSQNTVPYVHFMFMQNMKEFMDNVSLNVCKHPRLHPKHITQTLIHVHWLPLKVPLNSYCPNPRKLLAFHGISPAFFTQYTSSWETLTMACCYLDPPLRAWRLTI